MTGYLYNILGNYIEELYWSEIELDVDELRQEYQAYQIDIFSDDGDFEEWWNQNNKTKIKRVFLEEIYI